MSPETLGIPTLTIRPTEPVSLGASGSDINTCLEVSALVLGRTKYNKTQQAPKCPVCGAG